MQSVGVGLIMNLSSCRATARRLQEEKEHIYMKGKRLQEEE
jgi:hypothetical protein